MRKVNSRVAAGGRSSVWTRPQRVTSPHPATRTAAAAAAMLHRRFTAEQFQLSITF